MIMLIVRLFQVFNNAEVEQGTTVSLERFCDPEAQEKIRKHIGYDFDATEEFAIIDKLGFGEVRFDNLMNYLFKRSLTNKKINV